jgi:ubiquinone/menaquinone biosynthesis C-methylase UbiE
LILTGYLTSIKGGWMKQREKENVSALKQDTIAFYDGIAEQTYKNWKDDQTLLPVLEHMMEQLPPHPLVLDLGCGTGVETRRLVDSGASVVGIDLSEKSLQIARSHVAEATFLLMDILEMCFEENHFNGVLDAGTLFHFNEGEQNQVLKTISSIMKADGIFLSFYPSGDTEGVQEIEVEHIVYRRYVRHLDQDQWIAQVMKNGFKRYKKIDFSYMSFKATEFWK